MTLLTGLLPGLRDLRSPFSVGVLWALILYWWFEPRGGSMVSDHALSRMVKIGELLPAGVGLGIAASAIYLLGAVAMPMQNYLLHFAVEGKLRAFCRSLVVRRRRCLRTATSQPGRFAGWMLGIAERVARRLMNTFSRESGDVERLLSEGASRVLVEAGVPGQLTSLFPGTHLAYGLRNIAPQLADVSVEQSQQWDRLQAEGEFRRALVVPLAAALFSAGVSISWVMLPFALVVPIVLLGQAYRKERAAEVVLASAVYSGRITPPILANLKREIERNSPDPSAQSASWFAAMVVGARRVGDEGLAYGIVDEASRMYGYSPGLAGAPEAITRRDPTAVRIADYTRQKLQIA